jgi:hypothetical protein
MKTRTILAGAAAGVLLFGGAATADVVKLRNGDALDGRATDLGESVQVVSGEQTLVLPWSKVSVIEKTDKSSPSCQGGACPTGGFEKAAADLKSKGFVSRDGKWILKEEADALDRRAAIEKQATEEEKRAAKLLESLGDRTPAVAKYAAEALAAVEPDLRRRLYLVGARHRNEAVRAASAKGLGVKGDEGVVRTLLQLAVKDGDAAVRDAAAHSLKAVALPEIATPLIRTLDAGNASMRMNAAHALQVMGTRRSVETLIRRVHWVAGASNRANVQVLNQVSYISDYDVEIAQLSQIGDPIVSQLRDGVVLDVKVWGAEGTSIEVERRAYVSALEGITGKSFGSDVKAWASWWVESGKKEYAVADAEARAKN